MGNLTKIQLYFADFAQNNLQNNEPSVKIYESWSNIDLYK